MPRLLEQVRNVILLRHYSLRTEMSVIGAVMRKLIHIAYGVLKSARPFDPELGKSA